MLVFRVCKWVQLVYVFVGVCKDTVFFVIVDVLVIIIVFMAVFVLCLQPAIVGACHIFWVKGAMGAYPGVGAFHSCGKINPLGAYPGVGAYPGYYGISM